MTYFDDLTAYTYNARDVIETDTGWIEFDPPYDRINVGWIDAPHAFTTGAAPAWLAGRLLDIIAGPTVNAMRGFHRCTFCPRAETTEGTRRSHCEIRVPAGSGAMYAAPRLIGHYVTAHRYLPPADFVQAVDRYDPAWTTEPSPWIPENAERTRFD